MFVSNIYELVLGGDLLDGRCNCLRKIGETVLLVDDDVVFVYLARH